MFKLARMPDGSPEIFFTLQGEGRHTGAPSVFIRSSLCNLHCHWCDTPYTWNWKGKNLSHESGQTYERSEQIIQLSADQVAEIAGKHGCSRYVFTGGEPLLQERSWLELMAHLSESDADSHFEIETNGTLLPCEDFLKKINQLNVSPKLANSQVTEKLRYKPEICRDLATTGKADFKFVVGNQTDLEEILAIISAADIPADRVYLMALAATPAQLDRNHAWVAEQALAHGFSYCDRLHLRLYGAKRGT